MPSDFAEAELGVEAAGAFVERHRVELASHQRDFVFAREEEQILVQRVAELAALPGGRDDDAIDV